MFKVKIKASLWSERREFPHRVSLRQRLRGSRLLWTLQGRTSRIRYIEMCTIMQLSLSLLTPSLPPLSLSSPFSPSLSLSPPPNKKSLVAMRPMHPLTGSDGKSCAGVICPALPYAGCIGVTPWDACCPKCGTYDIVDSSYTFVESVVFG